MESYYQEAIKLRSEGARLTQEQKIFVLIYGRAIQGLKTPLPMILDLRIANHTARLTALHKKFPGAIKNEKKLVGQDYHSEYWIDVPCQLSIAV